MRVKDATRHAITMNAKQAKWAEVQYHYLDASGEEEKEIPGESRMKGMGLRKGFAVAKGTEVDGANVVIWGGVNEKGRPWMMSGWSLWIGDEGCSPIPSNVIMRPTVIDKG